MAFPTVALLDSFIRAGESPLSNGGKWSLMGGAILRGQVKEEAYVALTAYAEGEDGAYWNVAQFSAPGISVEYRSDIGNPLRYYALWACLSSPGTGERSGYRLRVERVTAGKYKLVTERMDKAAFTTLAEVSGVALAVGDRFGLQVAGGVVTAWKKIGAGAWTVVHEAADSTYNAGYVGIGMRGNLGHLRNFEVGSTHEHTFKASQSSAPSHARAVSRVLGAATGSSPTRTTRSELVLAATQAAASSAPERSVERVLAIPQPSGPSVERALARRLVLAQSQVAGIEVAVVSTAVLIGISESSVAPKFAAAGVAV